MKKSEHQIQSDLMGDIEMMWAAVCPHCPAYYPELETMYAIPNGGYRSARQAAQLVDEGVRSGIPDLCLPVARNGYFGLYIEMKKPGGVRSDNQKRIMMLLKRNGYDVRLFYESEKALSYILDYLDSEPT